MFRRFTLVAILLLSGCGGPPQLGRENVRLVESLRTAVSARRADWLDETAKTVTARHTAGQLDDGQFQALEQIIDTARSGDWETAESSVIALAKAQKASP